jgi:hypothetical protein
MFDSLTPDELVQAMSDTLRTVASSAGTFSSEFDQVQCLSGASIGRYLAQELAHGRELEAWFGRRVDETLAECGSDDDLIESLGLDLYRRVNSADDIDESGGAIADYLRNLDKLPATEGRQRAESLMHRCLSELADRQVQMLLGEYPRVGEADDSTKNAAT